MRRKRATTAASDGFSRASREGCGGAGGRKFCGAKNGGSTITAAGDLVAEVAREAHRHPAAERMADDDGLARVERARRRARCARLAHELLEDVSARASPSGPCR